MRILSRFLLGPDPADDKQGGAVSSTANPSAKQEDSQSSKGEESLSDVVRRAAKESVQRHSASPTEKEEEGEETTEVAETGEEESSQEQESQEEGEQEEQTEGGEKLLPFQNHPRWKEVLSERDEARQQAEKLRPMAEMAESLSNFCHANNISDQDLRSALELAALAQKDPREFRRAMQERLDSFDVAVGTKLPEDLLKKVNDGVIDEETAKEVARLRLQNRQSEQQGQRSQQQARVALEQSIAESLNQWEDSQRRSDPDYGLREEAFQDRVVALWQKTPPSSVQDAIKLVEQANLEVRNRYAKLVTKPKKEKRMMNSNGSSTVKTEELKIDDLSKDLGRVVRSVAARHGK